MTVRTKKLEGEASAQVQEEYAHATYSTLLPLPEIPSVLLADVGSGVSKVFNNFRRLGLTYLDENGEQLEFSAGTGDDDKGGQVRNEEGDVYTSECSDSESVDDNSPFEWNKQDAQSGDYWPYPSKTVRNDLKVPGPNTHAATRCLFWTFLTICHI